MRRLTLSLGFLALLVAPAFGATWNRPGYPLAVTSSTDNAIVRFDGASGAQQNSGVTIDDSARIVRSAAGSGLELQGAVTTATTPQVTLSNASPLSASVGTQVGHRLAVTTTQSGTAAYEGVVIDITQTSTGSGTKVPLTIKIGGASVFSVTSTGAITGSSFTSNGTIQARSTTAIPAGGTAGSGFTFYSTANFGFFGGSGAPTLSAARGSIYLRSDPGGPTERLYQNTDGGTTWTTFTAAN